MLNTVSNIYSIMAFINLELSVAAASCAGPRVARLHRARDALRALPVHHIAGQMKHIRTWLFLPYATEPPHAIKLIFDFFLLMFASRQLRVFRVENMYGDHYLGGSNREDIGKDWETPEFVNPVPDFLGYVGSWLDVVKRMVFLGMLWVTLAIMFMTGTNRVNLFSMGYLIGSFIFLWQGTDFYLRPKHAILLWLPSRSRAASSTRPCSSTRAGWCSCSASAAWTSSRAETSRASSRCTMIRTRCVRCHKRTSGWRGTVSASRSSFCSEDSSTATTSTESSTRVKLPLCLRRGVRN
ncbi:unnamed protein product [Leptidea sinapis]|uniref:Piezo TM25-28 domain-containing protein n=1 Tax=Leptidea sinapis TaxID=189913 RepID=A0A5E4QQF3_9NEOP|nr:unnamed protein product [Leptidea sinapis]